VKATVISSKTPQNKKIQPKANHHPSSTTNPKWSCQGRTWKNNSPGVPAVVSLACFSKYKAECLPSLDRGRRAGAHPLPVSSRAEVPPTFIQNRASCPRNQGGTWKRLGKSFSSPLFQLPTSAKVQTEEHKRSSPHSLPRLYYRSPHTDAGRAAHPNTHPATPSTHLR